MDDIMQRKADRPRGALRRMAGVSLLELLTVVTIIGILGMIAIPSYRQYTRRAHRTEAKEALLQLATNEERFYLQNRRYGTVAELAAAPWNYNAKSENGVYSIAINAADWTLGYTATATPVAGGGTNGVVMTDDAECASFSLTSQGTKTAAPDPSGHCW